MNKLLNHFFTVLQMVVEAVMEGNSALVTVLRQEMDRFNNLLHVIHSTMKALILAIKGEVIMSEQLEDAYNSLLTQRVPQKWKVRVTAKNTHNKPLYMYIEKQHLV